MSALFPNQVIVSAHLTEKASLVGQFANTYVFKVNKDATKTEIKKATEEIFGVVVKSIRVLNTKFKNKRTRFGKYKTKTFKKAYIKLEEGKEINLENPFK